MLNDYFHIIHTSLIDNKYAYTVRLNSECSVFEGHFPSEPIAPGVCNILMILKCVEDAYGKPVELSNISRCKFMSLIRPDDSELTITFQLLDNKLTASISQADIVCMTLAGTV